MNNRDTDSDNDRRPIKRARHTPPPTNGNGNGNGHAALPPLSLSILGIEPLDEFIREIADFVHHMVNTRPPEYRQTGLVEVEAKIGVLRDKVSGQRLQLPVLNETILVPDSIDCRFESNMSKKQHQHYNILLNSLKTETPPPTTSPVSYAHLHLVDSFYPPDPPERDKIRVTRDEHTSQVRACMRKIRLGSLDIYNPKQAADWRISVNLEVPVPPPVGTATLVRRKDRLSYSHEEFIIDLTQVTSTPGQNAKSEVLHELEVEIARPDYVLATAARRGNPNVSEHERSAFDELIRAFVNNARILVRNSGDGWV